MCKRLYGVRLRPHSLRQLWVSGGAKPLGADRRQSGG
jgi:hypothetical protein